MPRPIEVTTEDGLRLSGVYCPGNAEAAVPKPKRGAVFLHMMPATKESWTDFKAHLVSGGVSALALDLRGHGQSFAGADGRRLDYRLFGDAEHGRKALDVAAAVERLSAEAGIPKGNIALIGASIGANLAIAYAAGNPEIPVTVALSPGLDYHGLTTEDKVRALAPGQCLYLAASAGDEESFRAVARLREIRPEAVVREFPGRSHGTDIFRDHPDFMVELAAWILDRLPETGRA